MLVDSGVLFAAIARRDQRHQDCASALRAAHKPLLTNLPVITEFLCFAIRDRLPMNLAWALLDRGLVEISPITAVDLPALQDLMTKYADRPMDFADATLVHVAGREGIADILTIDHDDFETYRFGRNRRFRIAPAR